MIEVTYYFTVLHLCKCFYAYLCISCLIIVVFNVKCFEINLLLQCSAIAAEGANYSLQQNQASLSV